jgi:hypothetical protein
VLRYVPVHYAHRLHHELSFGELNPLSYNVHATVKRWTVDADVYRLSSDVNVIRQRQPSDHH